MKELITIKQLPQIEENFKQVHEEVKKKVENALSLACTDETVKDVKSVRAQLNKEFKVYEEKRKEVKSAINEPYKQFEDSYKLYISDLFKFADVKLKERIDEVEKVLIDEKINAIKEYFENHPKKQDFISFERLNLNIIKSKTDKKLMDEVDAFLDKVESEIGLIETQEHSNEIMVEYKSNIDVAKSIMAVKERKKALEEMEEKAQEVKEDTNVCTDDDFLAALDVNFEEEAQEVKEEFETIKVTCSREKMRLLKVHMDWQGGYIYE